MIFLLNRTFGARNHRAGITRKFFCEWTQIRRNPKKKSSRENLAYDSYGMRYLHVLIPLPTLWCAEVRAVVSVCTRSRRLQAQVPARWGRICLASLWDARPDSYKNQMKGKRLEKDRTEWSKRGKVIEEVRSQNFWQENFLRKILREDIRDYDS